LFGVEYKNDGNYMPMMGDLNILNGKNLDKTYTSGMIMHHQGAIQMAQKILTLTSKTELKNLANNIITTQNTEIATLKNWMMSKYNDHTMMGM
jgi:uncharacterized protein (DUF305 family)